MDTRTRRLIISAASGALYAVLTMTLLPISYGAVQFRVSEVLCILPFFLPYTVWGLYVGCVIANLISAAGILDIVFGALATLLAGLCTAYIGKKSRRLPAQLMACAMPVLFNGPIVGAVLAWSLTPDTFWSGFALFGAQVAVGEAAVLYILGLPAMRYLIKRDFFRRLDSGAAPEQEL